MQNSPSMNFKYGHRTKYPPRRLSFGKKDGNGPGIPAPPFVPQESRCGKRPKHRRIVYPIQREQRQSPISRAPTPVSFKQIYSIYSTKRTTNQGFFENGYTKSVDNPIFPGMRFDHSRSHERLPNRALEPPFPNGSRQPPRILLPPQAGSLPLRPILSSARDLESESPP